MYAERHRLTVTTAADGSATAYTPVVTGQILSVIYTKHGTTPYTDGVDFTITTETTGQTVWTESNVNASAQRQPRVPTHDGVGAASLYAAAGEPVETPIMCVQERVKVVLAAGGDSKVGTFDVIVG